MDPVRRRKPKRLSLKEDKAKDSGKHLAVFSPFYAFISMVIILAFFHPRVFEDLWNIAFPNPFTAFLNLPGI